MITSLAVTSAQGDTIYLQLGEVSAGIAIEEIEGLDPVKASIVSSTLAGYDGTLYQASQREERNIKLKLGLEPDWSYDTVRSVRQRVYSYFMPKSQVQLRFTDDEGPQVDISGRVESCESSLFSSEPQMDISIICNDPDFSEIEETILSGSTVSLATDTTVVYDGSVETPLLFNINVNRTLPAFTIYVQSPDSTIRMLEFSGDLVAGDVLFINTAPGQKAIDRVRAGSVTSLLYGMSPQSDWVDFQPGTNKIRIAAPGAAVPYLISYITKYGGL